MQGDVGEGRMVFLKMVIANQLRPKQFYKERVVFILRVTFEVLKKTSSFSWQMKLCFLKLFQN